MTEQEKYCNYFKKLRVQRTRIGRKPCFPAHRLAELKRVLEIDFSLDGPILERLWVKVNCGMFHYIVDYFEGDKDCPIFTARMGFYLNGGVLNAMDAPKEFGFILACHQLLLLPQEVMAHQCPKDVVRTALAQ